MRKMSERQAKKRNRKPFMQPRRDGSVAARSSAIRQSKLAESRSHNGSFDFPATKSAAQKALSRNVSSTLRKRNWRRSHGTTRPSGGAARNIRVLISNQSSRFRIIYGAAQSVVGIGVICIPQQFVDLLVVCLSQNQKASNALDKGCSKMFNLGVRQDGG